MKHSKNQTCASRFSRRDFLRLSALSAGTVVATSALPSFGKDDPSLFANRGVFERLVLSYQHIHIGLKEPFSVLHLSDTHLTAVNDDEFPELVAFAARRSQTFGGRQEEALRDSLAWARKNVDYVIHTGDLIDFQTEANLALVRKTFGEEKALACAMGNHEYQGRRTGEKIQNTTEYNDRSTARLSSAYPFDISLQSNVVNGVNFVTLDQVYGFVTAKQVARFKAEVAKGLPIILCMHVPFFTDHIWRVDQKYWRRINQKYRAAELPDPSGDYKRQIEDPVTRDFLAYLKGEPLLKGILAGHLHITVQDRFSPTAMQYVVGGNFMFHGEEVLFT